MPSILEIHNISKQYQLRHETAGYLSLRDTVMDVFKRKEEKHNNKFWALKELSFEVAQGESLGIIGSNGAGKSTLLKILSRITPPTKGYVRARGRVASLLEVGTGFHPELSGRENIFFNGSVLGLTRKEITAKFDEIVAFAGTETFLDTPLKHYSSGMKLRLAFAVAAHLEPEILVIDEVLAVGDAEFQKKCLGKMDEVSKSGRTILFVSHNMAAVRSLCSRTALLDTGELRMLGDTEQVISHYLQSHEDRRGLVHDLTAIQRKQGTGGLQFTTLTFNQTEYLPGDTLKIRLDCRHDGQSYRNLTIGILLTDDYGYPVIHLTNDFLNQQVHYQRDTAFVFTIPRLNIKSGRYHLRLFLRANGQVQDWLQEVATIQINAGNIYNFTDSGRIKGMVQPEFEFGLE